MNKRATFFFLELGILALCLTSVFIPVFYGNVLSSETQRPLMPFALTAVIILLHGIIYSLIFNKLPKHRHLLWSAFITLVFAIVLWNLAWTEHPLWSQSTLAAIDMVTVDKCIQLGLPVVYDAYNSGAEGRIWDITNLTIILSTVFICAYFSARTVIKKLSKS